MLSKNFIKSPSSVLVLLMIITTLLPAFKVVPKLPNEVLYLYFLPIVLFLVSPKLFVNQKLFLIAALFLLTFFFYQFSGNYLNLNERVTETHIDFFASYVTPFMVLIYYVAYFNRADQLKISRLVMFLLVFTSITSIIALIQNPFVARMMIGGNTEELQIQSLLLNIGSYTFQYTLVLIAPIIYIKYKRSGKKRNIVILIIIMASVLLAQIIAAVVLLVLSMLIIYFFTRQKVITEKRFLIVVTTLLVLLFLIRPTIAYALNFILDFGGTGLEMLDIKLSEIINVLQGVEVTAESAKNINGYEIRKQQSIEGFMKSPLFGGEESGGHHYWIDGLAEHGLIGMFPIYSILIYHYFWVRKRLNNLGRVLLLNALICFVFIGLEKNITYSLPLIYLFIIPVLLLSRESYFRSVLPNT